MMIREMADPTRQSGEHHAPKRKARTTRVKPKFVDYLPDLQDNDDFEDKQHKKAPTKTTGPKKPKALAKDVDVNAVPNPAPDTKFNPTTASYSQTVLHTGILPAVPTSTSTPGFSPVPPLASFATIATYRTSSYSSVSSEPTSTSNTSTQQATSTHAPKHMPPAEVATIAVGGAFVLFGIFAAIWIYTKPKKRTYPTPSLPKLQEDYMEKKAEIDEESLFGGKERPSPLPGSNGVLWAWTQYPHTSLSSKSTSKFDLDVKTTMKAAATGEKDGYPFGGHGVSNQPATQSHPPIQQQLQSALSKAANRVSTMSASIYPSSPQSYHGGYTGIGIAFGGGSPLISDEKPILQRNSLKSSSHRNSIPLKTNNRRSTAGFDAVSSDKYLTVSDKGSAAAQPAAPKATLPVSSSIAVGGGRAPVKGPYAPTASMRSSASVSRRSVISPFDPAQYILPSPSPVVKSNARRERDTQALTSALGLDSSPQPPSPHTTIHPDDSITLAGDRRRSRNLGHARTQSTAMSPTMDAGLRLGNLMLTEYQSMGTLPSSHSIMPTSQASVNKGKKKADDKPPRVPSPPPLPSLAQMALAHTNPYDYNDYRSPTYSIYGLYEADRKSRLPGEGGY